MCKDKSASSDIWVWDETGEIHLIAQSGGVQVTLRTARAIWNRIENPERYLQRMVTVLCDQAASSQPLAGGMSGDAIAAQCLSREGSTHPSRLDEQQGRP